MEFLCREESITGGRTRTSSLSSSWPGRVLLERLSPQKHRQVGFREPPANDLDDPRESSAPAPAPARVHQSASSQSAQPRARPGSFFRVHPSNSTPPTQFLLYADSNASNPSARSLVAGALLCHTYTITIFSTLFFLKAFFIDCVALRRHSNKFNYECQLLLIRLGIVEHRLAGRASTSTTSLVTPAAPPKPSDYSTDGALA